VTVPAGEQQPRDRVRSTVDPAIMAARYAGTATSRRTIVLAALAAGVLLAAGIAVQAANLWRPAVMWDDLGFTVQDETTTTVRFSVRTEPGSTVSCSLVAVNTTYAQVGYREVELGPVPEQTTAYEMDVTTTELATSGSVDECRILRAG